MRQLSILRIVSKQILPYILLFALYVQFHGEVGPGGGFQAGVIFGAGVILYGLVFGLEAARRVARPDWIERLFALGLLIYAGTGVAGILAGGHFLDYGVLDSHDPVHGQHLGLMLIELGVGLTVACGMITIFFMFAGRKRA